MFVELCPEGFEEVDAGPEVELAAYVDPDGEARLRSAIGSVDSREVEAGWEDAWRAFHRGMRVGPLWVGPPWESPPEDAVVVVIEPGQAFGTGAHPTTRLCLELLLAHEPRADLVDLGCGSGVLAVASAKLGFAPVVALDVDPAAVAATRANAVRNGVVLEARQVDATRDPLPRSGLAVANLDRGLLERVVPRVESPSLILWACSPPRRSP